MNQNEFRVTRGRTWLNAKHNDYSVNFSYPPVQGTHSQCYGEIAKDSEIQVADGLDLAILTAGAYTSNEREWEETRKMFVSNYMRVPKRLLWIPRNSFFDDVGLSGVLVEKDWKGKGLTEKMEVPQNLGDTKNWKQNDSGIYVSLDGEKQFVPSDRYTLGEHSQKSFAKDGFARTILTEEGADLFAKTAIDSEKTPRNLGVELDNLKNSEQRVALLYEYGDLLLLGGYGDGCRSGRAFGVQSVGSSE